MVFPELEFEYSVLLVQLLFPVEFEPHHVLFPELEFEYPVLLLYQVLLLPVEFQLVLLDEEFEYPVLFVEFNCTVPLYSPEGYVILLVELDVKLEYPLLLYQVPLYSTEG